MDPQDGLRTFVQIAKADSKLGVLVGYGIVCEKLGEDGKFHPYYDEGDCISKDRSDYIPNAVATKAFIEFMRGNRRIEMEHFGEPIGGGVVCGMPIDQEIAKSLKWTIEQTGAVVFVMPDDPDVVAKAERGELKGFSMFGACKRRKALAA